MGQPRWDTSIEWLPRANAAQSLGFDARPVFRGKAESGTAARRPCSARVSRVSRLAHAVVPLDFRAFRPYRVALSSGGLACFTVSEVKHPK
jgi:hypothetical protein